MSFVLWLWYFVSLCVLYRNVGGRTGSHLNIHSRKNISFGYRSNNTEDDYFEPRIVGGEGISILLAPYQVSLQDHKVHFCGGSIITLNTIVTAAHCVKTRKARNLSIRAGSTFNDAGGVVVPIWWFIVHPFYDDDTADYDVAVLKLRYLLTYSDNIQPIRLAQWWRRWAPNTPSVASGWGTQHDNDTDNHVSRNLEAVFLHVMNKRVCQRAYGNDWITNRMLCVGSYNHGEDSCKGDSGGPLVIKGVLAGLVSFGVGCGRGIPGIYTNVPAVRDFIDGITQMELGVTEDQQFIPMLQPFVIL